MHYAREMSYYPHVQNPQYGGPQSYQNGLTSTPETQGYRAPQVQMVPQPYEPTGQTIPPFYPPSYPQPQTSWPSQSYRGIEKASGASVHENHYSSRAPRALYHDSDASTVSKTPADARGRCYSKSSSDTDKESKVSGKSTRSRQDLHSPSSDSETYDRKRSTKSRRRVKRSTSQSEANAPRYNGKFDFMNFKVQFECIAEDYGWRYAEKGKKLSRCLTDEARGVLSTLDSSVRHDYKTLCEALMGLHTTPGGDGLRRNELHQLCRTEGQCPNKFGRGVKGLAMRAYYAGDQPEAVMVQMFIEGLRRKPM